MAKKLTYRGFDVEQLKAMNLEEFSKLSTSRARRFLGKQLSQKHKKLVERSRKIQGKPIKTHCRDMIVIPEFIGKEFMIYNGKEYVRVTIDIEMLGQYLGEFAQTRRRVQHSAPGVGATRASKAVSLT